jgi:hypothetical protein
MGAVEAWKLADEILEIRVFVRLSLGHLYHVKQVAGHCGRTSGRSCYAPQVSTSNGLVRV